MKLFDVVPANFFSILSSSNREIYYDALMALHDKFTFELSIRVDDYISEIANILEDRAFELEYNDDDTRELCTTLSGKARFILKRIADAGWVDREFMDGSFVEIITPRSYAIPVLKLLSNLGDNSVHEYNSLVYATFSGLKQATSEDTSHLYEAVLSAKSNTEHLLYSLRTFYHGIREYLRDIVGHHDANLLLQDHFSGFRNLADRVYHPIKTLDSVHRYMIPIQGLLADILANEEFLQSMRKRAMIIKKYDDESMAEEEIRDAINYVLDSYQSNIARLVSEIDRKQSAYIKSSIDKIQYLITADQTIKSKLVKILSSYANTSDNDTRDHLIGIMEKSISANRQYFFDDQSLYHKNVKSRRVYRPPLAIAQESTMTGSAEKYLFQQLRNGYPLEKIRAFVDGLFSDGKTEIEAGSIPINSDSDFIMLIFAVIRQHEHGARYVVDIKNERVERNGYLIPNMTIRKKGATSHVA